MPKNLKKASLGHEGESLSSNFSERSDDKDEDDDGTCAEDNNCNGDGNGGGDRNTGDGRSSAEWLTLLGPSALTEALGAMAKSKVSSLTKSEKN